MEYFVVFVQKNPHTRANGKDVKRYSVQIVKTTTYFLIAYLIVINELVNQCLDDFMLLCVH